MTYQEAIEAIKIKEIQIEGNTIRVANFFQGLSMAQQALENQIPKKVKPREEPAIELFGIKGGICPTCGYTKIYASLNKYCHNCGQALNWSDSK